MAPRGLHVLLALAFMLAGCKETVYTKASEQSANEVLSALLEAGVDAEKVAADEKSFDIEVGSRDLARALAVMRTHGLPHARTETLGELFKKDGLVSTPAEERVRYIYGVSQELEKTLQQIDGVVQGRVHIVIPANDPLSDVKKPSSASVFVKYRPPADPATLGPLVRSLVVRGIEGLDAEHVSVAFVAGEPSAAAQPVTLVHWLGMKVAAEAVPWLWLMFGLPVACLAAWLLLRRGPWRLGARDGRREGQQDRSVRRSVRAPRPLSAEADKGHA